MQLPSGELDSAMEQLSLRRNLTLPLLIFYGLGNIVGAGIYVLVGKVVGVAGMYAPISFFISCLLALFTAFSYAELSARYPLSAGESIYVQHGFGLRFLSVGVGLLIVLGGMLSSAVMLKGFVGHLTLFMEIPDAIAIVVSAALLCGIAIWGIRESVRAAALLTILKLIGLFMVLWAGRQGFFELPSRIDELVPPFQLQTWHGIFFGGLLAFYAFIGFEDMVNVAEEVKNPERNMPISILTALAVATCLYILIAMLAVLTVSPALLQQSDAPLVLVYQTSGGSYPKVIAAIAMFAVINGVLIQIIMASRVLYGLGRKGWIPAGFSSLFSAVHPVTRTPVIATLLVSALIIFLALTSPIERLAEHASFVILIVFVLINAALWKIKKKEPAPPGVKTYPAWLPVAGVLTSGGFVIFEVVNLLGG